MPQGQCPRLMCLELLHAPAGRPRTGGGAGGIGCRMHRAQWVVCGRWGRLCPAGRVP